jgi:hypothetical protein
MANESEPMGAVDLAQLLLDHDIFDSLDTSGICEIGSAAVFTADDGQFDYDVIVLRRPSSNKGATA